MKKKLRNSIIIGAIIVALLVVVVIIIQKNKKDAPYEEVNMNLSTPGLKVPEETYPNKSDMTVEKIQELTEEKINILVDIMYNSKIYYASEISPNNYKAEDDDLYYVYEKSFLEELEYILSAELFQNLNENFTFLNEVKGISYYVVSVEYINKLIYESSINTKDIASKENTLVAATNEKINITINLNRCKHEVLEEDENYCYIPYQLELIYENDTWKINQY